MKEQERGGEHSRNQSLSKSLLLKSIQKNNKQTSRYSLLYIHFRGLFQARQKPEGMAKTNKTPINQKINRRQNATSKAKQ
jgi:hypothetical protein